MFWRAFCIFFSLPLKIGILEKACFAKCPQILTYMYKNKNCVKGTTHKVQLKYIKFYEQLNHALLCSALSSQRNNPPPNMAV